MSKVRKILPVSTADILGLEKWLEDQANNGLFPVSIGSWATFTTCLLYTSDAADE